MGNPFNIPPLGEFQVDTFDGFVWQEGKRASDFTRKEGQKILAAVDRAFPDAELIRTEGEWVLVDDEALDL
ncbi:MAG TPA: hypothetical protein VD978_20365 [Azospirillum sp.]|nr:hypothetical protein [Azospirillum sp.]